jgi:hypothetical protein
MFKKVRTIATSKKPKKHQKNVPKKLKSKIFQTFIKASISSFGLIALDDPAHCAEEPK